MSGHQEIGMGNGPVAEQRCFAVTAQIAGHQYREIRERGIDGKARFVSTGGWGRRAVDGEPGTAKGGLQILGDGIEIGAGFLLLRFKRFFDCS